MIELKKHSLLAGEFTITRRNAETGKVVQTVGPFSNLITNIGLNRIGSFTFALYHCYVGTGTVPPTVTDTTMSTFRASSSTILSTVNTAPAAPTWYAQVARTFSFAAGVATGNLTEVGIGWANNSLNSLWSRELIVDSAGNPITVTVLANEILEVTYALRDYLDTTPFSGQFTLNSILYNYTGITARAGSRHVSIDSAQAGPRMIGAYTGCTALGPITTEAPEGGTLVSSGAGTTYSDDAYVANSYTRTTTTFAGLTTWVHPNGVNGFIFNPNVASFMQPVFKILLDKPIPKTNLNTMAFSWSYSWGRYEP